MSVSFQQQDHAGRPEAGIEKRPLERYRAPAKPSLVGLSRAELGELLEGIGVPAAQRKMRIQQLWHWIYVRGATDFASMSNVSRQVRQELGSCFTLARPEVAAEQHRAHGECADDELIIIQSDTTQASHGSEIDQYARRLKTKLHRRNQAMAAGEEFAVFAMLCHQVERILDRTRCDVAEASGKHEGLRRK